MTLALTQTIPAAAKPLPERVSELLTMLTYRRPAGSKAEKAFIARYLTPLGTLPDPAGNHWLTIGDSPILWSSHTDTVHKEGGTQRVLYGDGVASTDNSNCLGADCTVGIWLMVNMIRAGISGTYVFHAAEEIGGLGSAYVAKHTPDRLRGLDYAIAFDRKGYDEIITHQMAGRCASDAFARSLGRVLDPLGMRPSDGGTFTDTANYADVIPECTNISVGYHHQHTALEVLSVEHAEDLLDLLLAADFSTLVCERDPTVIDLDDWDRDPWSTPLNRDNWAPADLDDFVRANPALVAAFLDGHGFTLADLEDYEEVGR